MTRNHLLVLSIGPVQDFIAAARRTRDLWFGSLLLSELSKAAARALHREGAMLIFPYPADSREETTNRLNPESSLSVANVILAEIEGREPSELYALAGKETEATWDNYALRARNVVSRLIDKEIWGDQCKFDDVIEVYAAWSEFDPNANDRSIPLHYANARARVMQLLAGRKLLRDFRQPQGKSTGRRPKSSLDGARDTVWKEPGRIAELFKEESAVNEELRPLRLKGSEQLDAIGVVKRLGMSVSRRGNVPSVSRIAADSWLSGASNEQIGGLAGICKKLVPLGYGTVGWKQFEDFPHEGSIVFANRHEELFSEMPAVSLANRNDYSDQVRRLIGPTMPDPYLAVLVADGDNMGAAISAQESPNRHRELSLKLTRFAESAERIVNKHRGWLVFSGGDDVVAFLPVHTCLEAARDLHEKFGSLTEGVRGAEKRPFTLSVGIAIGHFLDPLEDLLRYGREAEKHAKGTDRNGLAIHVYPRTGAPICLREQWRELTEYNEGSSRPLQSLDQRIVKWAKMYNQGRLSRGAGYDMLLLARELCGWDVPTNLTEESIRLILSRKQRYDEGSGSDERSDARFRDISDLIKFHLQAQYKMSDEPRAHSQILAIAKEWIVARMIARNRRQAGFDKAADSVLEERAHA